MEPERNRLKHLLIILLEALSHHSEDTVPARYRIHEKVSEAGMDEADVHGLLNWIEDQWQPEERSELLHKSSLETPATMSFRYFSETDLEYITTDAIGYLLSLCDKGEISRLQLEALLQYASALLSLPTVLELCSPKPTRC